MLRPMRLGLALFLFVSLIMPTGPVNASPQKISEDCTICGHVCCCPEICKPLIEKRKKEAASHCSVAPEKKQAKAELCDQSASSCQIQKLPPAGIVNFRNEAICSSPRLMILGDVQFSSGLSQRSIREASFFLSFLAPLEIPTPPPRHSPV